MNSTEYTFSMHEMLALQKRIKGGESISTALNSMVAFKEMKEPTADYLLAVWIPYAERIRDGEDVIKTLEHTCVLKTVIDINTTISK